MKTQRDTHGEEHHVKTKTKIGMMSLQVKEGPELPATTGSWKTGKADCPSDLSEGANPAAILISDFQLLELGQKQFVASQATLLWDVFFMAVLGN